MIVTVRSAANTVPLATTTTMIVTPEMTSMMITTVKKKRAEVTEPGVHQSSLGIAAGATRTNTAHHVHTMTEAESGGIVTAQDHPLKKTNMTTTMPIPTAQKILAVVARAGMTRTRIVNASEIDRETDHETENVKETGKTVTGIVIMSTKRKRKRKRIAREIKTEIESAHDVRRKTTMMSGITMMTDTAPRDEAAKTATVNEIEIEIETETETVRTGTMRRKQKSQSRHLPAPFRRPSMHQLGHPRMGSLSGVSAKLNAPTQRLQWPNQWHRQLAQGHSNLRRARLLIEIETQIGGIIAGSLA
jgi:hypothetical protein